MSDVILLRLRTEEDKQGGIAAIIEDHIGGLARPVENAPGILPIFLETFALEGKDRYARGGDGCGRMILRREDVARGPAHLGAELDQCLDQDRRLDRHMERARDAGALQGLPRTEFLAHRHQARHLGFGDIVFHWCLVVGFTVAYLTEDDLLERACLGGLCGRSRWSWRG